MSGGRGAISQFYAFERQPIPRECICGFLGNKILQNFAARFLRLSHSLRIIAVPLVLAKRADVPPGQSFGAISALLISLPIVLTVRASGKSQTGESATTMSSIRNITMFAVGLIVSSSAWAQNKAPKMLPYTTIDHPEFVPASQASFLSGTDVVIGVSSGGVAKAYPVRIWLNTALCRTKCRMVRSLSPGEERATQPS